LTLPDEHVLEEGGRQLKHRRVEASGIRDGGIGVMPSRPSARRASFCLLDTAYISLLVQIRASSFEELTLLSLKSHTDLHVRILPSIGKFAEISLGETNARCCCTSLVENVSNVRFGLSRNLPETMIMHLLRLMLICQPPLTHWSLKQ
jgi:hypothetical protein